MRGLIKRLKGYMIILLVGVAIVTAWILLFRPEIVQPALKLDDTQQSDNSSIAAQTQKRSALVIGNSNYRGDAVLENPGNDASDLAAVLKNPLGFDEVTLKTNLTRSDMQTVIEQFGNQLRDRGGMGLFYFSGHGLQLGEENYLIPIGAIRALFMPDYDFNKNTIKASYVLDTMQAAQNEVNIIILDACRYNPFRIKGRPRRPTLPGLKPMKAPGGSLIAYATKPGDVALDGKGKRNSPYAKHFIQEIQKPNLSITQVFTQVRAAVWEETDGLQAPGYYSELNQDFYFAGEPTSLFDEIWALSSWLVQQLISVWQTILGTTIVILLIGLGWQQNWASAVVAWAEPDTQLSPWEPLDHLKALWWLFVVPKNLSTYEEVFGAKVVSDLNPFSYRRRFKPRLDWRATKKIEIDFNQQPGARFLVGTLIFRNEGRVPWFGRLLRNKDYPDYKVEFSLGYSDEELRDSGFLLSDSAMQPLGFQGEGTTLMRQIKQWVSYETPIYVFLATDVLTDFKDHQPIYGSRTLTFGGKGKDFQISVDLWRDNKRLVTRAIEFDLELIPEQAKPPLVTYHPAVKNLEFKKSERVEIGTFKFESQAGHHFAHSFEDKFNLRSYKDNLPLANDNAVALSDGNIVVSPFERSDVDITVLCDGEVIPNPEPPSQDYSFNLLGEFAPGSKPSNHWFTLHRDPTRADLDLEIIQSKKTHRIHWDQQGHPTCRLVKNGIVEANGELLGQDMLELPPYFIEFDADTPERAVFKILIGNTGKAGLGWIKANLELALKFKASVRGSLKTKTGYRIEDSLIPVDNRILVKEGDSPEIILVQVDAATTIEDIVSGRIDPDGGLIEARLDIEIQDDEGAREKLPPRERHLVIRAPIGLEKLPHQNWLCIAFGTSTIAAAIGIGDEPYLLPLQKVVSYHDDALNLEDYDLDNTERGTEFLPSPVICDADLRQYAAQDSKIRRGFPRYQPASLRPGDPDFISLPATTPELRRHPGRVIYSLLSWLAQPSDTILLPDTVRFENENGDVVERNRLPLEKMVESGFAALAEAYITAFDVFEKGGQVVLTHPNTFTDFHKRKLHDIAWRALNQRLGIALPERIRLISETDALAYHYCRQRMSNNQQRTGWERLLIYNLGADTLDLSLIHVHWSREGVYPEKWQVENRLSLPVADNYLDRLLARLVDQCLKDLDPAIFEYRYPVVGQLKGDDKEKFNRYIVASRLWYSIRQTKHAWDGKTPFRVRIRELGGNELINHKGGDVPAGDVDKPSIEQSDNEFYLRIPPNTVHDYPLLREFIGFVTDTVVDELLQGAGVAAQEVDTVVVSRRGALWPGLRDRVWGKFPNSCEKPELIKDNIRAVVSGAIAWQNLQQLQPRESNIIPRLAILLEPDLILIPEVDWEKGPIDLSSSRTFSLVQVSHQHPDPRKDLNSLRCHFYIRLERYSREWKWGNDPRLFVRREGKTVVRMENAQGEGYDFKVLGLNSRFTSIPPWPIGGDGVLPPKELYY